MEFLKQLEEQLHQGPRLIAIETIEIERVNDLLLEVSRHSDEPYYMAESDLGLYRLGAAHITIPRTKSNRELLEHIKNSNNYAVYILREYHDIFSEPSAIKLLKDIATGKNEKHVIFLDEYVDIPKELKPYTLRSKHEMKEAG